MTRYVITTQHSGNDFSTGVVLSVEDALNPEDALNQWARRAIDDDFVEIADRDGLETKSRINIALWLVAGMVGEDAAIKIFEVTVNPVGDPAVITLDDLKFSEQPNSSPEI